ncbi:Sulfotransferase family protein [Filomicrobium insigne]|uniref:Sulfotransferase family protein n=1 Tax=Filomicrobium insigne TaxID=418854 RepID=A0A1H0SH65_9HYPH|nr:sulfotransferase family 2 domain-containing protein [Filomicrobium insigne]SDP40849.1 Sulfotransferase family protein [Filomicrobium insigne]
MIVSHSHRYIFMHCRKTAGTSVTVALAKHLGPRDIQIGAWREARAAGVPFNRRFWLDLATPRSAARIMKTIVKYQRLEIKDLSIIHKARHAARFGRDAPHASAEIVKAQFPAEWDKYLKFCFVRNPYAQAVSSWKFHTLRSGNQYSFTRYLEMAELGDDEDLLPDAVTNWPIYTIDDKIAVDFVGRYETLDRDMTTIMDRLGLVKEQMPVTKKFAATSDYRDFYTEDDRKRAFRLFEKEIETFGYTF